MPHSMFTRAPSFARVPSQWISYNEYYNQKIQSGFKKCGVICVVGGRAAHHYNWLQVDEPHALRNGGMTDEIDPKFSSNLNILGTN